MTVLPEYIHQDLTLLALADGHGQDTKANMVRVSGWWLDIDVTSLPSMQVWSTISKNPILTLKMTTETHEKPFGKIW
jgi:hypothetical protein